VLVLGRGRLQPHQDPYVTGFEISNEQFQEEAKNLRPLDMRITLCCSLSKQHAASSFRRCKWRTADTESSCQYMEEAFADKGKGVALQFGG